MTRFSPRGEPGFFMGENMKTSELSTRLIKSIRMIRGIEQKQIAQEIGRSIPYVSEWERGKRRITQEEAEKISELLKIEVGRIVEVQK